MIVRTFTSTEDLFAYMQQQDERAVALKDSGPKVAYGDYVLRTDPFPIYGQLRDPMDYWKGRIPTVEDEEERAEYLSEKDVAASSIERGYWFGQWFSDVCPEGELGDAHVSAIDKVITKEEFEEARVRGWALE